MEETVGSIKEAIKGRFGGAIIGNFTLFLIILNWKIYFYAFDNNASYEEKIKLISNHLYSDFWICAGVAVLLTGFYIFLLPFGLEFILKYVREIEIYRRKKLLEHERKVEKLRTFNDYLEPLVGSLIKHYIEYNEFARNTLEFINNNRTLSITENNEISKINDQFEILNARSSFLRSNRTMFEYSENLKEPENIINLIKDLK